MLRLALGEQCTRVCLANTPLYVLYSVLCVASVNLSPYYGLLWLAVLPSAAVRGVSPCHLNSSELPTLSEWKKVGHSHSMNP